MDKQTTLTIADVLREGLPDYLQQYGNPPKDHYKVLNALFDCRTEALGSHLYRCDECGKELLMHHSCRNRHCPTCQKINQAVWVQERLQDLLPVQYFHTVFTLPEQLNCFFIRNRAACYKLLFDSSSQTLLQLAADPKWLGASIGIIAVLHTWGQRLDAHPHLHCIVPGGGIDADGKRWKYTPQDFFIPFRVLSQVFRGKFMQAFKDAIATKKILFHGTLSIYQEQPHLLQKLINDLYNKDWVVYAKESLANPNAVIKYLGQYTHRTAISNSRLQMMNDGKVTFAYKDYAAEGKTKSMTLSACEFVRRFLLHVLPSGFVRIRHYGLLANRNRHISFKIAMELLGKQVAQRTNIRRLPWYDKITALTGRDPRKCPVCKGLFVLCNILIPYRKSIIGLNSA